MGRILVAICPIGASLGVAIESATHPRGTPAEGGRSAHLSLHPLQASLSELSRQCVVVTASVKTCEAEKKKYKRAVIEREYQTRIYLKMVKREAQKEMALRSGDGVDVDVGVDDGVNNGVELKSGRGREKMDSVRGEQDSSSGGGNVDVDVGMDFDGKDEEEREVEVLVDMWADIDDDDDNNEGDMVDVCTHAGEGKRVIDKDSDKDRGGDSNREKGKDRETSRDDDEIVGSVSMVSEEAESHKHIHIQIHFKDFVVW